MVGVGIGCEYRARIAARPIKPTHERRRLGERIGGERHPLAQHPAAQPVLVKRGHPEIVAEASERMKVAEACAPPADELDPKLERTLARTDEVHLIQPEDAVEPLDRRDRRLADAHRADLLRFDERDRRARAGQRGSERSRSHPARASAAGDHDAADRVRGPHAASGAGQVRLTNRACGGIFSAARAIASRRCAMPPRSFSIVSWSTIGS